MQGLTSSLLSIALTIFCLLGLSLAEKRLGAPSTSARPKGKPSDITPLRLVPFLPACLEACLRGRAGEGRGDTRETRHRWDATLSQRGRRMA